MKISRKRLALFGVCGVVAFSSAFWRYNSTHRNKVNVNTIVWKSAKKYIAYCVAIYMIKIIILKQNKILK